MNFLKDCRLNRLVVYVAKRVRHSILHDTMLTLAKKLTPKFFENDFGLNAPHAWTLGYLLDPLIVSEA